MRQMKKLKLVIGMLMTKTDLALTKDQMESYRIGKYIDQGAYGLVYESLDYDDVVIKISFEKSDIELLEYLNKNVPESERFFVKLYDVEVIYNEYPDNIYLSVREKVNTQYKLNKESKYWIRELLKFHQEHLFDFRDRGYKNCTQLKDLYQNKFVKDYIRISIDKTGFEIPKDSEFYNFYLGLRHGFIFEDVHVCGTNIHNVGSNLQNPNQYLMYDC